MLTARRQGSRRGSSLAASCGGVRGVPRHAAALANEIDEPAHEWSFLKNAEDGKWDQGGLIQGQGFENIGDQIRVSDIKLPAGAVINLDPEEVVALAQEIQQEAEEETAAPDMDSIEVEQKGKDDESEEGEKEGE